MESKIIGNDFARQTLKKYIEDFTGFLFLIGPECVGKKSMCAELVESSSIDFDLLDLNKESINNVIDSSFFGGNLSILDNVDKCNDSVQDALLKIVENEYDDGFRSIMIVHDEGALTPALRSRIRNKIRFSEVDDDSFSKSHLLDVKNDSFYRQHFYSRPACYLNCVSNDSWKYLYNQLLSFCNGLDITRGSFPSVLSDLEPIDRLCVNILCENAAHNSERMNLHNISLVLNYGSTILGSPSCNSELHWWGMIFG